jgi:hypothetical protein
MQCVPFSTAKVRIVNGDDLAEDRGKSGGSPHADERDIGVRVRVCKSFGQYSSTPRRSIGRYSTRTEDSNQQKHIQSTGTCFVHGVACFRAVAEKLLLALQKCGMSPDLFFSGNDPLNAIILWGHSSCKSSQKLRR